MLETQHNFSQIDMCTPAIQKFSLKCFQALSHCLLYQVVEDRSLLVIWNWGWENCMRPRCFLLLQMFLNIKSKFNLDQIKLRLTTIFSIPWKNVQTFTQHYSFSTGEKKKKMKLKKRDEIEGNLCHSIFILQLIWRVMK